MPVNCLSHRSLSVFHHSPVILGAVQQLSHFPTMASLLGHCRNACTPSNTALAIPPAAQATAKSDNPLVHACAATQERREEYISVHFHSCGLPTINVMHLYTVRKHTTAKAMAFTLNKTNTMYLQSRGPAALLEMSHHRVITYVCTYVG